MNDRLVSAVRVILAREWDPLGTIRRGGFDNEYDSYVARVVEQLRFDADQEELASLLVSIELKLMLIEPDPRRAHAVARSLSVSVNCRE